MRTFCRFKNRFGRFCLLSLALALSACASKTLINSEEQLRQAYSSAILDAEIAETGEISKNLIAIVPANNRLIWKKIDDRMHLLVVTWTSWDGYDEKLGQNMELGRETWVTVVPELKDFCLRTKVAESRKALRLEQLLGLPPKNGKTKFVELWVDPADLFRPAPDPEISDHEAELDFPVSARYVKIDESHKIWFESLKGTSYGEDGYPWTRLGYTYDWGGSRDYEIGLSEFVIRQGALVTVKAVTPTSDYCSTP